MSNLLAPLALPIVQIIIAARDLCELPLFYVYLRDLDWAFVDIY